jgi:phosphatidylserine decarboxylase
VFARGAGRFIGPAAVATAVLGGAIAVGVLRLSPAPVVAEGLLASLLVFLLVFFRDPERAPGRGIVAPADGRVRAVEREGERWRISVFMNVSDVHVNRSPIDGRIEAIDEAGHGHRPAYRADTVHNVQRRYRLETAIGPVEVVQMTGILARRLVSFVRVGDRLARGERFGMIVLGSRVDLLLPASRARPTVRTGERVRAGSSCVAEETA